MKSKFRLTRQCWKRNRKYKCCVFIDFEYTNNLTIVYNIRKLYSSLYSLIDYTYARIHNLGDIHTLQWLASFYSKVCNKEIDKFTWSMDLLGKKIAISQYLNLFQCFVIIFYQIVKFILLYENCKNVKKAYSIRSINNYIRQLLMVPKSFLLVKNNITSQLTCGRWNPRRTIPLFILIGLPRFPLLRFYILIYHFICLKYPLEHVELSN